MGSTQAHVLLVDDEIALTRALGRWLGKHGYQVTVCPTGEDAARCLAETSFDVIVVDIFMPGMSGIDLLRIIRKSDTDVPVILMTASPQINTAVDALELGCFRYLTKPFDNAALQSVIEQAVRFKRLAELKRQALELAGESFEPGDLLTLSEVFKQAVTELYLVFQPIVSMVSRKVFAYEALMRSRSAELPHPGAILSAGERLKKLPAIGEAVRRLAGEAIPIMPAGTLLFVNLHPQDFLDETLYDPMSKLAVQADRIVLEVTERAALDELRDIRDRVTVLRGLGYRIAVDDLGAGYAGLAAFANLEPDVVKIDMALVRDVDSHKTKHAIVESLVEVCRELNLRVVAEGVETEAERDALVHLGCDLLQGYYFARPAALFAIPAGFKI